MTSSTDPASRLATLLESANSSVIADAMRSMNTSADLDRTTPPQPGQVWRLRWNDDVVLAVISRVGDDHLLAMPAVLSSDAADEGAVIVPGDPAGFATDVAVFAMLETGIGTWALEFLIGDLVGTEGAATLRQWLKGTIDVLPDPWRHGHPTTTDAHPRAIAQRDLGDLMTTIGAADWLPTAWRRNHVTTAQEPVTADYMRQVAAALGGPRQRASAIARGLSAPDTTEARKLLAAGIEVRTQQPAANVIYFLDGPEAKGATIIAFQRLGDEGLVRRRVAEASLVQAARAPRRKDSDHSDAVLLAREELLRLAEDSEF
jgi:hypothetical protein